MFEEEGGNEAPPVVERRGRWQEERGRRLSYRWRRLVGASRYGERRGKARALFVGQIGPVVEAKTAQTSRVLESLSQTRRFWDSGPGHQRPL